VDTENIYYQYEPARDDAVKLRKYLGEDDSVYVLTEKYTTEYRIYYNYELLPVKNSYHEFPTDDSTYEPIYDWEPDQLLNNLKNYKYVYLRIKNGNFKDKYGDLFANPEDITDTSLYSFGSDGLLYKVY
jgi:hypothetical protein